LFIIPTTPRGVTSPASLALHLPRRYPEDSEVKRTNPSVQRKQSFNNLWVHVAQISLDPLANVSVSPAADARTRADLSDFLGKLYYGNKHFMTRSIVLVFMTRRIVLVFIKLITLVL